MRRLLFGVLFLWVVASQAQTPVYLDESRPIDERVDDAIARMTDTEKQSLLNTYNLPKTSGVPRLGIQPFVTDTESNTMFPSFECLGASWNVELARQYGCAVAEQALYRHVDRLYDPDCSMMGEEPLVTKTLLSPYIEGVHSYGVETYQDGLDRLAQGLDKDNPELLLRQIVRGHLEKTMSRQRPLGMLGTDEQKALAKTVAEEGIVLLKNDNQLLPLKGNSVRSLWLIGDHPIEGLEEALGQHGVTVRCKAMSVKEAQLQSGKPDMVVLTENLSDQELLFLRNVPVVIQAWDLGEMGPSAFAAVVCGDANPSGKLPFAWPSGNEENPTLFALGSGLSYTNFEFTDFSLSSREVLEGGDIIGTVTVTNIGDREGAEVVQLYIHDIKTSLSKPDKELKGFQKVFLKPGESTQLSFVINENTLLFYDPETKQMIAEPGFYVAFIGNAADNLPVKARFHLK